MLASYAKRLGDKGDARRELLKAAVDGCKQGHRLYSQAYERWNTEVAGPIATDVRVAGRMIVGLGTESVLETGITLHHTYGTPMIPGSALKGLANHYCDRVWGLKDTRFRAAAGDVSDHYHEVIFGTTEDSGHILFRDAWITPKSLAQPGEGLVLDVMTPHHGSYYMADASDNDTAPTDFDDPNPVLFLSATGTFRVAVECDVSDANGERWARMALKLLTEALRAWGIGGKTSAGYGRMAAK